MDNRLNLFTALLFLLLPRCGGDEPGGEPDGGSPGEDAARPDAGSPGEERSASMSIGPSGATFTFEGMTLEVPEGALEETIGVTITRTARLPQGFEVYSALYELEPSGTVFLVPVTVEIRVPEGSQDPTLFWSTPEAGGFYDTLARRGPSSVIAQVGHFSEGFGGRSQGPACMGAEGSPCRVRNGSGSCFRGVCQLESCDRGFGTLFKDCDGNPANGCEVDVLGDTAGTQHCGDCNRPCGPYADGTARCERGMCRLTCNFGFGSCDGDDSDGCETPLSNPRHCGGCFNDCSRVRGSFGIINSNSCIGSAASRTGYHCVCIGSQGECDRDPFNGCETPLNTEMNCGACGRACSEAPASARPVCKTNPAASPDDCLYGFVPCSLCGFECLSGAYDCDKRAENGCESEIPCPQDAGVADSGCLGLKEGACPKNTDAGVDWGVDPACVGAGASPNTLADSVAGFSSTQGTCGWEYGSIDQASGAFSLLPLFSPTLNWGPSWYAVLSMKDNLPWIWSEGAHPRTNYSGPKLWADRVWTSPVSAPIRITGQAAKADTACGDGTRVSIRVDGAEVWSASLAGSDGTGQMIDVQSNVSVGSRVELIVAAPTLNDSCDATRFTVVIAAQ
jgi:hypothetical protein